MFRTSNPAFSKNDAFRPAQSWDDVSDTRSSTPSVKAASANHMTVRSTVTKTSLLLSMCVVTAMVGWNVALSNPGMGMVVMFGGLIGGLVFGLICGFFPKTSPVTAPLYALTEGLFVGGISAVYAQRFATEEGMLNTGLILNAGVLTFGIMFGLLGGYATGIIRPGPLFKRIVTTATLGVAAYALLAMGLGFTGIAPELLSVYNPSNGGLLSIGFSLFVVGLASANLVMDFDFIERGARNRAPKYMEWYAGFGLLVTLVWLYLEVLRLLAKLQSRE